MPQAAGWRSRSAAVQSLAAAVVASTGAVAGAAHACATTSRSSTTASSATCTRSRWSAPTAPSTGTAPSDSMRPACSRRCSTVSAAATSGSAPAADGSTTKQLYFPDTNVLITRFLTPEGVGEVQDFMPIHRDPHHRRRLVRRVICVRGDMHFRLECEPRFDYARASHETQLSEHGAVFHSADLSLMLESKVPLDAHRARRRRRLHALVRRQLHLLAGVLRPRHGAGPDRRGRGRRGIQPHRPLLARLAGEVALPRPLARDGAPLGADPEAAHLPPHRRAGGGAHHQPARGHRR